MYGKTQQKPLYSPMMNKYAASLSKDVVVQLAYFDSRPRNGYRNATVLFVNINKTIVDNDWIMGCGADKIRALNFSVYSIYENELIHNNLSLKGAVYQNKLILCYDIPAKNGSSVFAIYKTSQNSSSELITFSKQPLYFPSPRVKPRNGENFTIVVCSKVHNKKVPWFREFIQYQRTLGVDLIDFSVLDTFVEDNGYDQLVMKDSLVLDALSKGFIRTSMWNEMYNKNDEVYFHSDSLRKLSCVYRYLGTYDYAMPLDTDDFFVPQTKNKTLKDYIKQYCHDRPAGSCRFEWARYFPDCGLDGKVGSEGNVTAHLKSKRMGRIKGYKSVYKMEAVLDASFHNTTCDQCLLSGYEIMTVPRFDAYVAHIRFGSEEGENNTKCS